MINLGSDSMNLCTPHSHKSQLLLESWNLATLEQQVTLDFCINEQTREECLCIPGVLNLGIQPTPVSGTVVHFFLHCSLSVITGSASDWPLTWWPLFRLRASSLPLAQVWPFNSQWPKIHDLEFPSNWACQLLLVIAFLGPAPKAFHLSRTWGLAPGCVYPGSFWQIQMASMQSQPNWPEMKNVVISNQ